MVLKYLVLILIFSCSMGFAQSACHNFFKPAIQLSFPKDITVEQQKRILDLVQKIKSVTNGLELPTQIKFSTEANDFHEVGFTDPVQETVTLLPDAFRLNPKSFDFLVAHEITHIIVAKNFKSNGNNKVSLQQDLTNKDTIESYYIAQPHFIFAELLCDTLGVIITGNPKAAVEMMTELIKLDPKKYEQHLKHFSDLNSRDFTISPQDPRWATHKSEDFYNRMNQIRAYVWNRFLKDMPANQQPAFFEKLLRVLDPLYHTGNLDQITAMEGIPKANQQLIEYLESVLP